MKKLFFPLLILFAVCLSMIFFVANLTEKQIKIALDEVYHPDVAVELVSYQKGFLSSTVITEAQLTIEDASPIAFKVTTKIKHYPYQAVLNSDIQLVDEELAKKAALYFGRDKWISSVEKINLFSQLSGQLTLQSGKYESKSESWQNQPLVLNYQIDLKNKQADLDLNWAGGSVSTYGTSIYFQGLNLTSQLSSLSMQGDSEYQLKINTIDVKEESNQSLLQGINLTGHSQQGKQPETLDTLNDLTIDSYQVDNGEIKRFTNNRLKLALTGLYQPAFELINTGSNDAKIIQQALTELVGHGAQLSIPILQSQTPWGEVDGELNLLLDKGAPLMSIVVNPYVLFDYMSGDARLVLPVNLLEEPLVADPLQLGVMTGFLEVNEKTLNVQMSFQQGELTVNDRVVPL